MRTRTRDPNPKIYNRSVEGCGSEAPEDCVCVLNADAQTLRAAARITNINFTAALQDPSSLEYKNVSGLVMNEVESVSCYVCWTISHDILTSLPRVSSQTLQSVPAWILDLVHSGKVVVIISSLSPGSVVVTFTLVFLPDSTQNIYNISRTLIESLQHSTHLFLDPNSTNITGITCVCVCV